ncbi:oligosaccharide flippase family protein [Pelobacter propionicus]|uniref:Polysaccharide biosynthesis protein n=1 Tax=Pelobacter propionicus (strain DSM 2379 / NBRC 103807 / OttBd1) TaxID=338966 RepID=A1ARU4_PELPD|nr:oligosaccharide flippase family protein [Pelobacter propionicus]ABL00065.1 polysaccharide biosynthesis protein [Pelobacter propionicus DSM 2379]
MSLKNSLCDISKHSLIYMLGWGIAAAIRLGMLPLFTRCLGQQDYGIISILDSSVELLRILCALGFSSAIVRFYNDSTDVCFRRTVMATGACFSLLATVFFGLGIFPFSKQISEFILGNGVNVLYFKLAFATILLNIIRSVADSYLTVNKYSVQYIVINTVQVVFQSSLNLYLVVFRDLGVTGMLVGNLLVAFIFDVGLYAFVAFKNGLVIDFKVIIPMLKFSLPLVPTVLAAAAMHNLDRFFIKFFASMEDVGLYSLAYQFPFMLNTVFMSSFVRIWESSSIYEIAKYPDASYQYGKICTYFMTILAYALLILAVMSDLVMKIFAAPSYFTAHEYIPIISLGVWGYALHTFVRVGVNLSKKTHLFTINYMLTLIYNVGLNCLLVPKWGAFGAAWATVGTYFGFSIGGYIVYRKYNCVNIEWSRLVMVVLMAVSLVAIKQNTYIANQLYYIILEICLIVLFPILLIAFIFATKQPEVIVIKNIYAAMRKFI